MKFSIYINQLAASEVAPELDLIDLAIFDYIRSFILVAKTGGLKAKILQAEGDTYYWINYKYLLKEMPVIKFKQKASLSRRFEKLRNSKLIRTLILKGNLYAAIGEKALYLEFEEIKIIGVCEWCRKGDVPLLSHHYPIPKAQGGEKLVKICPNCHYKYHYQGWIPPSEANRYSKVTEVLAQSNTPVSVEKQHNHSINNDNNSNEGAIAPELGRKGDPRVKTTIEYFSQMCRQIKGFKPVINWGAEGAMVKRYLNDYSDSELNQAFLWFLESEESERLGCTIKVALSNYVFNKWLAQRNL